MAIIDYGAIVKKNGKIIQTEAFMDMKEAVGFELETIEYYYKTYENNYKKKVRIETGYDYTEMDVSDLFSYMGDKELLIGLYRTHLYVIENCNKLTLISRIDEDYSLPYPKQVKKINIHGVDFTIKRFYDGRDRYRLTFNYKGDKYDCLYGYGVDINKDYWYYADKKEKRKVEKWFANSK